MLLGCGLRRAELVAVKVEDFALREEHWVLADLIGKGRHMRTIPVPGWVKSVVDAWIIAAQLQNGVLFRAISKTGKVHGEGFTAKVIWSIVREAASGCGFGTIAPHDLRRTCARLCHQAGGELEQIQFLLGHVSIQTTERYLGCKQRLQDAVNVQIGLEPEPRSPPY
jgi:site-specific recombinase XerD